MVIRLLRHALVAAGIAGLLVACGAPVAQPQVPTTTVAPITLSPTATVPAADPTTTAQPTPDPTGLAWVERDRSDYNGDGRAEVLRYLPAEVTPAPGAGFADDYFAAQAISILAAVVLDDAGNELLRIHHVTGIHAAAPLRDFPVDDPPAAFLLALDPGSSYTIALQPLRADGTRHSPFIGLNYYGNGFGIAPSGT